MPAAEAVTPEAEDLRLPVRSVSRLRVMSFNVRWDGMNDGANGWDARRSLVFRVLEESRPDVVGLQEASDAQVRDIVESVSGYAAAGGGAEDGAREGLQNAIVFRMDRFEALAAGMFWLSAHPGELGSHTWGNRQPRTCTWARLRDRLNGAEIVVWNTHLDHQSAAARERALRLLAHRVRASLIPAFVTGDFNLEADASALRAFLDATGLRDSFRAARPDPAPAEEGTFHGFRGARNGPRVDFVLVPARALVRSAEIVRTSEGDRYPSDHFPMLTEALIDATR